MYGLVKAGEKSRIFDLSESADGCFPVAEGLEWVGVPPGTDTCCYYDPADGSVGPMFPDPEPVAVADEAALRKALIDKGVVTQEEIDAARASLEAGT